MEHDKLKAQVVHVVLRHLEHDEKLQQEIAVTLKQIDHLSKEVLSIPLPDRRTRQYFKDYMQVVIEGYAKVAKEATKAREALVNLLTTFNNPDGDTEIQTLLNDL